MSTSRAWDVRFLSVAVALFRRLPAPQVKNVISEILSGNAAQITGMKSLAMELIFPLENLEQREQILKKIALYLNPPIIDSVKIANRTADVLKPMRNILALAAEDASLAKKPVWSSIFRGDTHQLSDFANMLRAMQHDGVDGLLQKISLPKNIDLQETQKLLQFYRNHLLAKEELAKFDKDLTISATRVLRRADILQGGANRAKLALRLVDDFGLSGPELSRAIAGRAASKNRWYFATTEGDIEPVRDRISTVPPHSGCGTLRTALQSLLGRGPQ